MDPPDLVGRVIDGAALSVEVHTSVQERDTFHAMAQRLAGLTVQTVDNIP
jgi:hypothetical protein